MASTREWSITALRLGGELMVIVGGVLIALSADAWLEGRQDRGAEIRHLQALREDLLDTQVTLGESNGKRMLLFSSLVRLSEEELAGVAPDSVARWVYDGAFSIASFEPQLTALSDLQSSDQFRLLTPQIRREVAELERLLGALGRVEADFVSTQQNLLDPYLVERLPLAEILAVADSLPLSARLSSAPDWSALQDEQIRNALAFKLSLGKVATGFRGQIAGQIDELLVMINARLGDLGSGTT